MANTLSATTADSLSPSQKIQRKAFYVGLTSILTEEQAHEALDKWATFINETGSAFNGLNSFARDVCKNYAKDEKQRDLVRALNRALFYKDKIAEESKAEVKKPILEAVTSVLIELPASTPDFQTFESLFMKILRRIKNHSSETNAALHIFLNELIQSMPWSEIQQQQITILIDSGTTTQIRAYRPDQLKTFMRHLNSWLASEIGKQEADAIWTEAIKETETQALIKYPASNFA